jgi:hypothetical protein
VGDEAPELQVLGLDKAGSGGYGMEGLTLLSGRKLAIVRTSTKPSLIDPGPPNKLINAWYPNKLMMPEWDIPLARQIKSNKNKTAQSERDIKATKIDFLGAVCNVQLTPIKRRC